MSQQNTMTNENLHAGNEFGTHSFILNVYKVINIMCTRNSTGELVNEILKLYHCFNYTTMYFYCSASSEDITDTSTSPDEFHSVIAA